jgi:hypothetical protein
LAEGCVTLWDKLRDDSAVIRLCGRTIILIGMVVDLSKDGDETLVGAGG